MLNESQKARLTEHIYNLLKESLQENGFYENYFMEKKKGSNKHEEHDNSNNDDSEETGRREIVKKWLDSAQELHSVLSYELWPDKDEDSARSEFSKKYRGHDDDGKPYHFDDMEINRLYNMRDDFISRAGLDKNINESKSTKKNVIKINKNTLTRIVTESMRKIMNNNI